MPPELMQRTIWYRPKTLDPVESASFWEFWGSPSLMGGGRSVRESAFEDNAAVRRVDFAGSPLKRAFTWRA